jgi:hypothetical protein
MNPAGNPASMTLRLDLGFIMTDDVRRATVLLTAPARNIRACCGPSILCELP